MTELTRERRKRFSPTKTIRRLQSRKIRAVTKIATSAKRVPIATSNLIATQTFAMKIATSATKKRIAKKTKNNLFYQMTSVKAERKLRSAFCIIFSF